MSVIDLIRNNVIATLVAGTLAGGTIIYVAAPGLVPTLGSRNVPDVFEVLKDGVTMGKCDLTINAEEYCFFKDPIFIRRHARDKSKIVIDTGMGGNKTIDITWNDLSSGVVVGRRDFRGNPHTFTISAKPL